MINATSLQNDKNVRFSHLSGKNIVHPFSGQGGSLGTLTQKIHFPTKEFLPKHDSYQDYSKTSILAK